MGHPTKIATCCHCGSKAALTLDEGRHELSCASCGAPLRHFKMMPKPDAPARRAVSHHPALRRFPAKPKVAAKKKPKPRKARKTGRWFKGWVEEVFDAVEDIFD